MGELTCARSISDNTENKDRFCPPHTSVQFRRIPLVCFSDRLSLAVLPGVDLDPVPTCESLCRFLRGCDWSGFLLLRGMPLCLFLWPRVHTPAALHNEKQLWRWRSWVGCTLAFGSHRKRKPGKLQGGGLFTRKMNAGPQLAHCSLLQSFLEISLVARWFLFIFLVENIPTNTYRHGRAHMYAHTPPPPLMCFSKLPVLYNATSCSWNIRLQYLSLIASRCPWFVQKLYGGGGICELPNQSTEDRKRETQSLKLDRKLFH